MIRFEILTNLKKNIILSVGIFIFNGEGRVRCSSLILIFVISFYFSIIIFLPKNHFSKWHFCFKEVRDQREKDIGKELLKCFSLDRENEI